MLSLTARVMLALASSGMQLPHCARSPVNCKVCASFSLPTESTEQVAFVRTDDVHVLCECFVML